MIILTHAKQPLISQVNNAIHPLLPNLFDCNNHPIRNNALQYKTDLIHIVQAIDISITDNVLMLPLLLLTHPSPTSEHFNVELKPAILVASTTEEIDALFFLLKQDYDRTMHRQDQRYIPPETDASTKKNFTNLQYDTPPETDSPDHTPRLKPNQTMGTIKCVSHNIASYNNSNRRFILGSILSPYFIQAKQLITSVDTGVLAYCASTETPIDISDLPCIHSIVSVIDNPNYFPNLSVTETNATPYRKFSRQFTDDMLRFMHSSAPYPLTKITTKYKKPCKISLFMSCFFHTMATGVPTHLQAHLNEGEVIREPIDYIRYYKKIAYFISTSLPVGFQNKISASERNVLRTCFCAIASSVIVLMLGYFTQNLTVNAFSFYEQLFNQTDHFLNASLLALQATSTANMQYAIFSKTIERLPEIIKALSITKLGFVDIISLTRHLNNTIPHHMQHALHQTANFLQDKVFIIGNSTATLKTLYRNATQITSWAGTPIDQANILANQFTISIISKEHVKKWHSLTSLASVTNVCSYYTPLQLSIITVFTCASAIILYEGCQIITTYIRVPSKPHDNTPLNPPYILLNSPVLDDNSLPNNPNILLSSPVSDAQSILRQTKSMPSPAVITTQPKLSQPITKTHTLTISTQPTISANSKTQQNQKLEALHKSSPIKPIDPELLKRLNQQTKPHKVIIDQPKAIHKTYHI